jgi:hypothetical protein
MVVLEFLPARHRLRRNLEALLGTMQLLALTMDAATRNIETAVALGPRMRRNRRALQQAYEAAERLGVGPSGSGR